MMWEHDRIYLTVEKENLASCKHYNYMAISNKPNQDHENKAQWEQNRCGMQWETRKAPMRTLATKQDQGKPVSANQGRRPSDEVRTQTGFNTEFPLAFTGKICSQYSCYLT